MPRPKKCRKICAMPVSCGFGPVDGNQRQGSELSCGQAPEEVAENTVEMTLDEYETIRLIDLLDYRQEECAKQMGVARTTVQAVYNDARKKLAQVLIEGKFLSIKGGNYIVCPRAESCKNKRGCQYENCSYMKE